jgi:uncharacterized membrane protein
MPTSRPSALPLRALLAVVWLSAGIFSFYIAAFYGGAIFAGTVERDWNEVLPRLYEPGAASAAVMIGIHFIAGSTVLLLGPLQFITALRTRHPRIHRWTGRVYLVASLLTGVGGLAYLLLAGAVGGPVMAAGFGLYGMLTVLAAVQAWRHAVARRMDLHRAWAIRLFALGIGSWLYRMYYGIWLKLLDGPGHTQTFDGPFDMTMSFFFYLPNLLVAEYFIRRRGQRLLSAPRRVLGQTGIVVLALVLLLATWLFAYAYWLPHIARRLGL